jgi:hypothetical protein
MISTLLFWSYLQFYTKGLDYKPLYGRNLWTFMDLSGAPL